MTMDDERFFAWLDGELPADEAAIVARAVAGDPALAAKADAHRTMQARLAAAFAPIAEQPFALDGAGVVDLAARRDAKRGLPSALQWGAMAATLIVGMIAGTMVGGGADAPVASRQGMLVASADLGTALDAQLASAPAANGPRVGLTFRDREGGICRSFTDGATQGLACRDGEDWRLRALVQGPAEPTGDFRMAAGADPALAATIDSMIEGEPFDAAQEKAVRDAGWR